MNNKKKIFLLIVLEFFGQNKIWTLPVNSQKIGLLNYPANPYYIKYTNQQVQINSFEKHYELCTLRNNLSTKWHKKSYQSQCIERWALRGIYMGLAGTTLGLIGYVLGR